jgi:hypothetical protein
LILCVTLALEAKMIDILTWPDRFGKKKWDKIPNGPFPISMETLEAARKILKERIAALPEHQSLPKEAGLMKHTLAREILKEAEPRLTDFDRLCLSAAITCEKIKEAK